MKHVTRPQYYRIKRVVEMLREGSARQQWPNSRDFMRELEVFSFAIAWKLLASFEGTPLELDMRSVLKKIAESSEESIMLNLAALTDQFTVLPDDRVRVNPAVWEAVASHLEQTRAVKVAYERFDGARMASQPAATGTAGGWRRAAPGDIGAQGADPVDSVVDTGRQSDRAGESAPANPGEATGRDRRERQIIEKFGTGPFRRPRPGADPKAGRQLLIQVETAYRLLRRLWYG